MKAVLVVLALWILATQSVIAADCCCGISCEDHNDCYSCDQSGASDEPVMCVHVEPNQVIVSAWESPPSIDVESLVVPIPVEFLTAVPEPAERSDHPPRGRPILLVCSVLLI